MSRVRPLRSAGRAAGARGRHVHRFAHRAARDARARPGDAKILRNAGARVTDDVLRTLVLADYLLGVERAMIIGHTDCRMAASGHEVHAAMRAGGGPDTRSLSFLVTDDQEATLGRTSNGSARRRICATWRSAGSSTTWPPVGSPSAAELAQRRERRPWCWPPSDCRHAATYAMSSTVASSRTSR